MEKDKNAHNVPVRFSASFKVISSSTVTSDRPFWFTLYAIKCNVGDAYDDGSDGDKSVSNENKKM